MKHYYSEIIENKEYREDRSLMYEETRVILTPLLPTLIRKSTR
jgi:hypothetical protein